MVERIVSDEVLGTIRRTCYEAGKEGREVFTVRGADGPEVVRCRDCARFDGLMLCAHPGATETKLEVDPDGFCAWGERRDGRCAIG